MEQEIKQGEEKTDNILTLLLIQKKIVKRIKELSQKEPNFLFNEEQVRKDNTLLISRLASIEKLLNQGLKS